MNTIKEVIETFEIKGYFEIQDGVYIQSKEQLISDQKEWEDEDTSKKFDFTAYPYWIITDDGAIPDGYDSLQEILDNFE